MSTFFAKMMLTAGLGAIAFAQTSASSGKTFRGVLMDSSCKAIQAAAETSRNRTSTAPSATADSSKTGVNPSQSGSPAPESNVPATSGTSTVRDADVTGGQGTQNRAKKDAVSEVYKECKLKPATSSYALLSDGKVYLLDDTMGSLRQKMTGNTSTGWITMSVIGSLEGDKIKVSSVQ